uniref:Ras GTPase-activating protein 3-like n=2 Tax=Hirondellea gigas TaxID=1518452 RepID=A0A6A7G5G4_9CRUS
MAPNAGTQVRLEQRLKVKLGEAKNLLARSHGSVGVRDIYCVLSLDQEPIFRSATVEKTLDPFFGEEFQFDIPREFRFLSVYVYDRDRPMKTDKIFGKVSIKREDLTKHNGKDQWLAITPVDADSEVQGKVLVRIQLKSLRHMNDAAPQPMVEVKIEECSDLCIVNGSCDPYAVVTMHYTNKKQENKRTKTKKKTAAPHFDETFFFEQQASSSATSRNSSSGNNNNTSSSSSMIGPAEGGSNTYSLSAATAAGDELGGFQCLQVAMWHESAGMFGNVFLGEVRVPLHNLTATRDLNVWYLLQPRQSSVRHSSGGSSSSKATGLGSLRLNLHYSCTHVFPSPLYDTLRSLLLHTAHQKPVRSSVGWLLGEVCGNNKQEAAVPLTRVLLQNNQAVPFIANLAALEMYQVTDPNTIFRGNTLASKCMDELMKLSGQHYLKETLKPAIDQVCREKKPCEVDPARIPSTENRDTNLANLCEYTNTILRSINNSALSCPPVMCQIFSELREHANAIFPNQREVRYSVISGFIFLRFFAPAILGPKLFDITKHQIDMSTLRTLTLISKTVQGVGNLVSSRNLNHTCKEEYMRDVFALCTNNKLVDAARTFLEIISCMPNGNLKAYDTPVILREGVMIKRAQGRKKFGLKNFKTRFFRLNTRSLTYAKNKGSVPLCIIPVEDILAVEPVQESSFKCNNMFQLVQPNRTLYIQAANCVEEKEWLDLLTKVCQYNKHRLKQYHPGAYLNSHWQCCKAGSEHAPGCSAVSNYLEVDLNIQIDAEREMESILGLLLSNITKLKQLHEVCKSGGDVVVAGITLEEPAATQRCIERVMDAVMTLHQHHMSHRNTLRHTTRPGSKQAPIGDDNYLLLSSNIGQHDNIIWDTGQLSSIITDSNKTNISNTVNRTNSGDSNNSKNSNNNSKGNGNNSAVNLTTTATTATPVSVTGTHLSAVNVQNSNNLALSTSQRTVQTKQLVSQDNLNVVSPSVLPGDANDYSSSSTASKNVAAANSNKDNGSVYEVTNVNSSSSLTISNIRDSIKRSTTNRKKLLNSNVNDSMKGKVFGEPSDVVSSLEENFCSLSSCSESNCCERNCSIAEEICEGGEASDWQDTAAIVSVADVDMSRKTVAAPQPHHTDFHGDTVQKCLGSIADAVKSSAEYLHRTDKQYSAVSLDAKDLLNRVSLSKQSKSTNNRALCFSSNNRPYSDDIKYAISAAQSCPPLLRHSALPALECLADDWRMDCTHHSSSGSSSANTDHLEPMDVCSSSTTIKTRAMSSDGVIMYATEVEQCYRTVYQEASNKDTLRNVAHQTSSQTTIVPNTSNNLLQDINSYNCEAQQVPVSLQSSNDFTGTTPMCSDADVRLSAPPCNNPSLDVPVATTAPENGVQVCCLDQVPTGALLLHSNNSNNTSGGPAGKSFLAGSVTLRESTLDNRLNGSTKIHHV